jgi:hypothetical protein
LLISADSCNSKAGPRASKRSSRVCRRVPRTCWRTERRPWRRRDPVQVVRWWPRRRPRLWPRRTRHPACRGLGQWRVPESRQGDPRLRLSLQFHGSQTRRGVAWRLLRNHRLPLREVSPLRLVHFARRHRLSPRRVGCSVRQTSLAGSYRFSLSIEEHRDHQTRSRSRLSHHLRRRRILSCR